MVSPDIPIRRQTMTGRPCGSRDFVARLEALTNRVLHPRKPGPKPEKQTKGT